MDPDAKKYLLQLRIISNIPLYGRFTVVDDHIIITKWNFLGSIYGLYDNGSKFVIDFLNDLYSAVDIFLSKFVYKEFVHTYDNYSLLISLIERISDSRMGLRNLMSTYSRDPTVVVKLYHIEYDVVTPLLYRALYKILKYGSYKVKNITAGSMDCIIQKTIYDLRKNYITKFLMSHSDVIKDDDWAITNGVDECVDVECEDSRGDKIDNVCDVEVRDVAACDVAVRDVAAYSVGMCEDDR